MIYGHMTMGEGVGHSDALNTLRTKLQTAETAFGRPQGLAEIDRSLSSGLPELVIGKTSLQEMQHFLDEQIGAHLPESAVTLLGYRDLNWRIMYVDKQNSPVGSVLFVGHEGNVEDEGEELLQGALATVQIDLGESGRNARSGVTVTGVNSGDPSLGYRIVSASYGGDNSQSLESVGLSFADHEYSRAVADSWDAFEHHARYTNNTGPITTGATGKSDIDSEPHLPGVVTREMLSIVSSGRGKEHTRCLVAIRPPYLPGSTYKLEQLDRRLSFIANRLEIINDRLAGGDHFSWDSLGWKQERQDLEHERRELKEKRPQYIPAPLPPKVHFGDKQLSPGAPTPFVRVHNDGAVELGIAPEPKSKRRGDNPRFSVLLPKRLEAASQ